MSYLLGIDIGTSGTKTLICDQRGKVLATASAPHTVQSPKPGWSEQSPEQWWAATIRATGAVLSKAKIKGTQVSAIGLSGQMHGSVFLDDAGPKEAKALRPALLWNDQRTIAECADLEQAAGGRKKLIAMTGNPALTGFTAPKILWVRKNEKRLWDKVRHILLPKDYIRYRMTGEYATEVGDASGTSLLDVKKRAWNKKLLSLLDLDAALLPKCFESHEVSGELSSWAAKKLGLAAGTPVVGGSGDQPAGAVGNGIVTAGIASATLGTSGVVFVHSDQPVYDPMGRVHTMCSAVAGKWCNFGCMLSAAGSFQWFRDALFPKESFESLTTVAAGATPGAEGLYFLPYLTGERCPYPNPEARGAFVGLTVRHDKAAMTRALLEGITFGMADQVRIFADEMGIPIRTLRLSGGGAKSPFWRQLQADIYGKNVATINSDEGPAYGVALLAGVGTGVWSSVPQACSAAIEEVQKLKPDRKLAAFYAQAHRQYQSLYPALAPRFASLRIDR